MEEPKTKHCWECRRRRLVCDFTRPKCRKCQIRGVDCPGYDGKKPLRWLQPQQVNAKGPEKMVVPQMAMPQTAVPRTVKPTGERQMTAVYEAIEYCKYLACSWLQSAWLTPNRQHAHRT